MTEKTKCEHKNTTYDSEACELTCEDCGEELTGRCPQCNWIQINRCGLCHDCLQKEALADLKANLINYLNRKKNFDMHFIKFTDKQLDVIRGILETYKKRIKRQIEAL